MQCGDSLVVSAEPVFLGRGELSDERESKKNRCEEYVNVNVTCDDMEVDIINYGQKEWEEQRDIYMRKQKEIQDRVRHGSASEQVKKEKETAGGEKGK